MMSKRERTIFMIAGLVVGLIIMPIAFAFGIAVIGVGFLAACANSMISMAESWWHKAKPEPKTEVHHTDASAA